MKEFWNARYAAESYAYGKEPNRFFRECLETYQPQGDMLFPGEGEGRNAVYAAQQGIRAYAFDISDAGRIKAQQLASQAGVDLVYEVGALADLSLDTRSYDGVALIFAHFPPPVLSRYHRRFYELLRPGGYIFLEGFSKKHLSLRTQNPAVGGPNREDMLFSKEEILVDFAGMEVLVLEDLEVALSEGNYHNGTGHVLRLVGRKPA